MTIRYWAAAKEAAGLTSENVEASTLADVIEAVVARHPDRPRLATVLGSCAYLVNEQPVGKRDPATVPLADGAQVEALPPFAGG
ncbi:molybdopterin converting factor small subunit [Tenggerimyces flavus]|nr:molybdopterin converting factor small subunit [Tenggerimyces flavus]